MGFDSMDDIVEGAKFIESELNKLRIEKITNQAKIIELEKQVESLKCFACKCCTCSEENNNWELHSKLEPKNVK